MSPAEVQAMFEAGASLVQLCTGLIYEGPSLLKEVCQSLLPTPQPETVSEVPSTAEEPSTQPDEGA